MKYPSNSQPHVLALLCISCIAAPAPAEGAFVVSNSRRRLPTSFARTSLPSPRSLPPCAMSTDDSEEEEKELPVSGSFFNSVPPPKKEGESSSDDDDIEEGAIGSASLLESDFSGGDMEMFEQIIKKTQVSRSGGGKGFGAAADFAAPSIIQTTAADKKDSFVGIGKPLNDIQNPEYDENGYTLYADETTGEKKRVFEALVDYPSVFKMKIVGKDDPPGTFAPEMVSVVAESCGVDVSMVKNTQRKKGKWTSVTVHAPVKNADMLYQLYENVDKDPRVKFKF